MKARELEKLIEQVDLVRATGNAVLMDRIKVLEAQMAQALKLFKAQQSINESLLKMIESVKNGNI